MLKCIMLNISHGFSVVSTTQDEELARQLVELGYRGSGEVGKTSVSDFIIVPSCAFLNWESNVYVIYQT